MTWNITVAVMRPRRLSDHDLELITEARTSGVTGRGRRLREAAHLTLAEVAARLSQLGRPVTRSAVGMWESGVREPSGPYALTYGRFLRNLEIRVSQPGSSDEAAAAAVGSEAGRP